MAPLTGAVAGALALAVFAPSVALAQSHDHGSWKDNPNGTFVNWHPKVSCDGFSDTR
jgi:hypothetical protein